ncbi:MAG: AEC family transporter, partial [Bacteroidota bacterium]|nr:AEC family transporter [Bacteroidota bacterium]
MTNLVLLLVCLGLGAALRHWQLLPPNAAGVLNQLLVTVLLPALTFLHLAEARPEARMLLPMLMPWLIFGVGWVFFAAVGRRLGLARGTIGALILT